MNNKIKAGKIYIIIAILFIVVGIVAFFTIGIAPSSEFNGVTRYSAQIKKADFEPASLDINQLSNDIYAVTQKKADTTISTNYSTGSYELCISVIPVSYELKTDEIITMIGEKYADLEITEFATQKLSPTYKTSAVIAVLLMLIVTWALALAATTITLGFKAGLSALVAVIIDSLVVFSIFIFARFNNFYVLGASVLAAVIVSLYFNIQKTAVLDRALQEQGNANLDSAVKASTCSEQSFNTILILSLAIVGFVVAALVTGISSTMHVGIMMSVTLLVSLLSSYFIVPTIWISSQK